MKVGAILSMTVTAGGGFNQSLNALLQMARLCEGRHALAVYTDQPENVDSLRGLGLDCVLVRPGPSDLWVGYSTTGPLTRKLQQRLGITGRLESRLLADGVDVAYFVGPSLRPLTLQRLPYIATVWDLCHRDFPEFPEVAEPLAFHDRELAFARGLPRAYCTLTDSETLSQRVARRYAVDPERLLAMPFAPSPFFDRPASEPASEVLRRHGLAPGYLFYPAQFWPHKNHVRILQALRMLQQQGVAVRAVFSGGDQGNRSAIEQCIRAWKLEVALPGFLPPADMRALYEGALAVVMPTYFGPTNLPPLEAWKTRCPLIYSAHLADQAGDAALLADPDDAHQLAECIRSVLAPEVRADLVARGTARLAQITGRIAAAEQDLVDRLDRLARRLECARPAA
jgi:glycosyltransferase involved in cell wall biosynthesis